MKLKLLYEEFTGSGAIAFRPAMLGDKPTQIRKPVKKEDSRWYLKFSKTNRTQLSENGK